jgi:hypothetical protein
MNSSPNRAPKPPGKAQPKSILHDVSGARKMLPLVRGIVNDIVAANGRLKMLNTQQELLDETRRGLPWEARQRRYSVHEEVGATEAALSAAADELNTLGVMLADGTLGRVDFPTRINGRTAAFSWQLGEDSVRYWRYSGEEQRRPIPTEWLNA